MVADDHDYDNDDLSEYDELFDAIVEPIMKRIFEAHQIDKIQKIAEEMRKHGYEYIEGEWVQVGDQ